MTCSNEEIRQIKELFSREKLLSYIMDTSKVAWNDVVTPAGIKQWLDNFTGEIVGDREAEQSLALWLLYHFVYYTDRDVRTLCKSLYRQILHHLLIDLQEEWELEKKLEWIYTHTVYMGLGNESESGNTILYYFRQENNLAKQCFELRDETKYIVFIDDITISGTQASFYLKNYSGSSNKLYFATLLSTSLATQRIKEKAEGIPIICTMTLEERDKAFSDNSYIFSNKRINKYRLLVRTLCEHYGTIAAEGYEGMKNDPLGFGDGQYLIGFHYNTPNNTLPIFWGEGNSWTPIFKRHEKIYTRRGTIYDERQYY